ncbi:hypothetical protein V8E36_007805 [Tilletia maclaganii]
MTYAPYQVDPNARYGHSHSRQPASGLSTVSPHLAGMHMRGIYLPASMPGQRSTHNPAKRVVSSLRPAHLFASSIQRPFLRSLFVQNPLLSPASVLRGSQCPSRHSRRSKRHRDCRPQTLQHPSFIGHIKTSVDAILLLFACDHSSHHHPCDASSPSPAPRRSLSLQTTITGQRLKISHLRLTTPHAAAGPPPAFACALPAGLTPQASGLKS